MMGALGEGDLGVEIQENHRFFFVGKPLAKAEKDLQMVGFPYLCWCKGG